MVTWNRLTAIADTEPLEVDGSCRWSSARQAWDTLNMRGDPGSEFHYEPETTLLRVWVRFVPQRVHDRRLAEGCEPWDEAWFPGAG